MKKTVMLLRTAIITLSIFAGITAVHAGGIPALDIYNSGGTSIIVLGSYDSAGFTFDEANTISTLVSSLSSQIGPLLGLSGLSTSGLSNFTPSQLKTYGYTDADTLKTFIKDSYLPSGFSLYIFLDITKSAGISQAYGQNLKINIWIADLASTLGMTGDYLYLGSIELPMMYITFLSGLFGI